MNKSLVIILLGALFLLAGGFYFFKNGFSQIFESQAFVISNPWIEVVAPRVVEKKEDGTARELKTGDEIKAPATVEAGSGAVANLYFPDGSVLRMDSDTRFTLVEASFDGKSEKLAVKVQLSVGRVWSKILALATTDSFWEVKTSNTVATVRGTAFGVEYKKGRSRVIGSENVVKVSVVDPATGRVIEKAEVELRPDTFVEVKDTELEKIKRDPTVFSAASIPEAIRQDEWVTGNKTEDKEFDAKLKEFQNDGSEGTLLRQEFRESLYEEFQDAIEQKRIENGDAESQKLDDAAITPLSDDTNISGAVQNQDEKSSGPAFLNEASSLKTEVLRESSPMDEKVGGGSTAGGESAVLEAPVLLELVTKHTLRGVAEGERIFFKAIAVMDNGTRREVTNEVSWSVVGPIGTIDKFGIFVARLDESVSELGIGFGSLVAVWNGNVSRGGLVGKTVIFSVEPKVELILDETAG